MVNMKMNSTIQNVFQCILWNNFGRTYLKNPVFGYVTHHMLLHTSGRRLKNAWRNLLKGSCIPTLLKNDRLASNNDTTMKLHKKS